MSRSRRKIHEVEYKPELLGDPTPEQLELIGITLDQFLELSPEKQKAARAHISDKMKSRRAVSPEFGHKRFTPHDYSGKDPAAKIIPGQIAPKLAGDRAKALMVLGRVQGFIEKYSKMAVDVFGGYSATKPTEKGAERTGVGAQLKPVSATKGSEDRRGQLQQMMSKERALQLVEKLPMLPSDQMSQAVRALAGYIWRIHKTARADIRQKTLQQMAKSGKTTLRKHYNPQTGEYEERPHYNLELDPKTGKKEPIGALRRDVDVEKDDPTFRAAIARASREFDIDSTQVKADLNLLFASAGALKTAGGFGGEADKAFLQKVKKAFFDEEGGEVDSRGKPKGEYRYSTNIAPKEPEVKLPPELKQLAGDYPVAVPKSQRGRVQAKGPIIRKADKPFVPFGQTLPAQMPADWLDTPLAGKPTGESFERYLERVCEVASADFEPRWWQDI